MHIIAMTHDAVKIDEAMHATTTTVMKMETVILEILIVVLSGPT